MRFCQWNRDGEWVEIMDGTAQNCRVEVEKECAEVYVDVRGILQLSGRVLLNCRN